MHKIISMKKVNLRKALDKARKAAEGLVRDGSTLDAYWEICCGDVLVAEENLRDRDREWENASLAREFLDIADYLESYDVMLDRLDAAASRMTDAISDHPSLKLRLLEFRLLVLNRIESMCGHETSLSEYLESDIGTYRHNIECADNGDFGNIRQTGHLKSDPVEWTSEYESVIDEVLKKVSARLKGHPRGMGFCHAFWYAKAAVLREDYGIEWRSPAVMNPGTMFD